jgi:hypothetical protein
MRYSNTLLEVILLPTVVSIPWLAVLPECKGAEPWPVRYNGPGSYEDDAAALALDAQGNVCVRGWS